MGKGEVCLAFAADREVGVEGNASEDDDHLGVFQELEFLFEVGAAAGDFLGKRLVIGRGAVDGTGDPGINELEAVVDAGAGWLTGETGVEEGLVEEVAGAITGEDAAGAVGAVGSGGEADDDEAGFRVTEGGYGAAPVIVAEIGPAFHAGDGLAVFAEARALVAGDDLALELLQAHSIKGTMRAYDKTDGSSGGGGRRGGIGGGFEAGNAGRDAGADGGLSGMAGVGGER